MQCLRELSSHREVRFLCQLPQTGTREQVKVRMRQKSELLHKKSGKVAKKQTAPPPGVNMYKTTVQGADQSVQRASQTEEARPVAGDLWSF